MQAPPHTHLGACCLAAGLALSPAAHAADAGQRAYEAGHLEDAIRAWQAEAQAGDKDASFALGFSYDLGQGVPQNEQRACHFYTEAAERGHAMATFNIAVMQDSGRCGKGRRTDLAALWYGRAAAAGVARAQFNLAQLYAIGDGVPRNPAAAAAWYRVAAANGIAAAANRGRDERRTNDHAPLTPASPTFPAPAQSLPPENPVTLVWTAPEQPSPVRFYVEIYALKPSGPVEVAGQFADVTALRLPVPPNDTHFTWRVLTVASSPPRYAISPWSDFQTTPQTATPQTATP